VAELSAPKKEWPLRLTLQALLAAACFSLFVVFKLQPVSAGAFVFLALWLALPHALMALLLYASRRKQKPVLPWCVATFLVTLGGIYVLADVIYWHPDAQGAIAVVLTPVLQGIAFAIAAPMAWWAEKWIRAEAP
jgi:hypothetical protein